MAVSLVISWWNSVDADYPTAVNYALVVWLLLLLTKSWLKASICFAFWVALCGRCRHCTVRRICGLAACHGWMLTAQEWGYLHLATGVWAVWFQQVTVRDTARELFTSASTGIVRKSALALHTPLWNVAPQWEQLRQVQKKKGETAILWNGLSQMR